jgi:Signal transduction histidine kinase
MKQFVLVLSLFACFFMALNAQNTNSAEDLQHQAQTSLNQKEYTKARYLFIQAYSLFSGQGNYNKAIDCGTQAAALYHKASLYKEAFDLCRGMEQFVGTAEQKSGHPLPALHYSINKERMEMYIALKRGAQAKDYLNKLEVLAASAQNNSVSEDLLYTQANYYYTFGMYEQGDASFKKLIGKYKEQKNYDKVSECYKHLITIARKANNAGLVARTYEEYIKWTDSAKALTAKDELSVLKKKFDESQQTITEKEHSLAIKKYSIIGLCVVIAILIAALVVGGAILFRYILLTRKQSKTISTINEHSELKTKFIQNISAQMEPTLDLLDPTQPAVKALHKFAENIQELSSLENSLSDIYEMKEINISSFCEKVMEKVKDRLKADVTPIINAPKLSVKTNPEQLERILLHLLSNAAEYTPEGGKIWLDFKKRGAHTHQIVVTDTGCGIPAEAQQNLFKPFTEVRDLTKGDGLGLPICALIAGKLNGSLTLDTSYNKGSRFILELHA